MSRPAPTRPGPGVVTSTAALVGYALRACVPPRRRLGLAIPCLAAVLFGALSRTFGGDASYDFGRVATVALFGLILPITTLVVGDAVLGAEVRRGSFTFTWMSPVPPWRIVIARWFGGTLMAGTSLGVAFSLAALVAGTPDSVGPVAVAGVFGSAAYVALFMAIGAIAQRAAVWSLAFVFLGERLLGAALSGVAQLSPSWEARMAFVGFADVSQRLDREGLPQGGGALVRLLLIAAVCLVIASLRLPRMRMASSSD